MNKMMLIAALMMTGSLAHADGFKCLTEDESLVIQAYNQTSPDAGTRNVAVMVLSNPAVQQGNKTVARFQAGQTLSGTSATYIANVDLRYNDSGRGGENLLGTKLAYLKTIKLHTYGFSYGSPVAAGSRVRGVLTWTKRDGSSSYIAVSCIRYLKN